MDNKEIVEKALRGEDVSELIKDYGSEQMTEYTKALKKAGDDELARVAALRKEKERIEAKPLEPTPKPAEKNPMTQFREEQVEKAKERFLKDTRFPLTDAEKASFEETFSRMDSGKVDADLIFKDLQKAYAALKSDDFIQAATQVNEFRKNAAEYNAAAAGGAGNGQTPDLSKFSAEAIELHKSWQKAGKVGKNRTLEAAQRVTQEGLSRRL